MQAAKKAAERRETVSEEKGGKRASKAYIFPLETQTSYRNRKEKKRAVGEIGRAHV